MQGCLGWEGSKHAGSAGEGESEDIVLRLGGTCVSEDLEALTAGAAPVAVRHEI